MNEYIKAVKTEINDFISVATSTVSVEKIYIFGSYAYGTPTKKSDLDFYVVTSNDSDRQVLEMQKISSAYSSYQKRATDILLQKKKVFEEKAKQFGTIENEVLRKGLIIYDKRATGKCLA